MAPTVFGLDWLRRRMAAGDRVTRRLTEGVFWTVLGNLCSSASTLLASIVVARTLGASDYGALGIIQSSLSTFLVFGGASLGTTGTKYIAELKNSDPERAGRILRLTLGTAYVLSGGITILLLLASPAFAGRALAAPHLAPHIRLAAITLFLTGVNGAQIGALAGFEAFRSIAKINIARGLLTVPLLWAGAQLYGLKGAVIGLGVVSAVAAIMSGVIVRRCSREAKLPRSGRRAWKEAGLLMRFSLPINLSGMIFICAAWMSNVILVRQTNGFAEMGIFNAANQWRMAILFLPSVMAQPFLAVLANLVGTGSENSYRRAFRLNIGATTLASMVPAAAIMAFSPMIMGAYGAGFRESSTVLALMAAATALGAPGTAIENALHSTGHPWSVFVLVSAWAIVFLSVFLGLRGLGVYGLGFAYLVSYAVHFVMSLVLGTRILRMNIKGSGE